MGWKDWPYWLKGGIIGGGIGFVLSLLSSFSIIIRGLVFGGWPDIELIWFDLLLILSTFIVGAVIGWIYGKIKSKTKK